MDVPVAPPADPGRLARERRHLLRFLAVGVLSVSTDLGIFFLLNRRLGWAYGVAKGVSYVSGMLLGFGLNKWWAFGSRRSAAGEATTYVILYGCSLGVNVLTAQGVKLRALNLGLGEGAAWAAGFLAATLLTTVLNYLGLRFITFRKGIAESESMERAR